MNSETLRNWFCTSFHVNICLYLVYTKLLAVVFIAEMKGNDGNRFDESIVSLFN